MSIQLSTENTRGQKEPQPSKIKKTGVSRI